MRMPDVSSDTLLMQRQMDPRFQEVFARHRAACWQGLPALLQPGQQINMSRLVSLAEMAFHPAHAMHGHLRGFPSSTIVHVLQLLPGVGITFSLSMTTEILAEPVLPSAWAGPGATAEMARPFVRLGVRVTARKFLDAFHTNSDVDLESTLELECQAEHGPASAAADAWIRSRDDAAYQSSTSQYPFAHPPTSFLRAVEERVKPRLALALKPHQVHAVAWALWREQEGFMDEVSALREPGRAGLLNIMRRRQDTAFRFPRITGGFLADDVGMGKTIETIGLVAACMPEQDWGIRARRATASPHPDLNFREKLFMSRTHDVCPGPAFKDLEAAEPAGTLVVVPVSLCSQWMSELEKVFVDAAAFPAVLYHGPKRAASLHRLASAAVVVTTIETIQADARACRSAAPGFSWSCNHLPYVRRFRAPRTNHLEPGDLVRPHYVVLEPSENGEVLSARLLLFEPMETMRLALNSIGPELLGKMSFCAQEHEAGVEGCSVCAHKPASQELKELAWKSAPPALNRFHWRRVVLDESHRLKTVSKQVDLLRGLCTGARWCLTATPLANNDPRSLAGQCHFMNLFAEAELGNPRHVLRRLKDVFSRHPKECIQLPEPHMRRILVNMDGEERAAYTQAHASTQKALLTMSSDLSDHTAQLCTLLLQERRACMLTLVCPAAARAGAGDGHCSVCMESDVRSASAFACRHSMCLYCLQTLLEGGFLKCPLCGESVRREDMAGVLEQCRQALSEQLVAAPAAEEEPRLRCASKWAALRVWLAESTGPAVLFTQFTETAKALLKLLAEEGYSVHQVAGHMSESERAASVRAFGVCHVRAVMVLTLRAASCGLNLTHASRLVHVDASLSAVQEWQANGRVHRQGQTHCVDICHLIYSDTVEERIHEFRDTSGLKLRQGVILNGDGVRIVSSTDHEKLLKDRQLRGLLGLA